jgi:flagellar secretion chaperone FliS
MHTLARAAATYQQVQVNSRSPMELVVMLYDGAIDSLSRAADAVRRRDLPAKRDHLARALAIVGQLQSTLDMDAGGEIAGNLDRLYTYLSGRILDASARLDAAPLDEASRLLVTLREGWAHIATAQSHVTAP